MKKLIYSKQFPGLDKLDVRGDELSEAYSETVEMEKDELMYVHLPERREFGEKFIERAKAIAGKYKFDIKIYADLSEIEVYLSFDRQPTHSDFPHLIGMAEEISFHAGANRKEFTICLKYYICEVYHKGKKIIPYPGVQAF